MTIPTLPETPYRGDPDTFSSMFENFLDALNPWAVAVEEIGDAAAAAAVAAAESAETATTQAGLATTNGAAQVTLATIQADSAAIHAAAAANSALVAGAVAWVSWADYEIGNVRYSLINLQTYRRRTNGAGTTDPSIDSTNWAKALETGVTNVVTATGMTTLTSTATLLRITPASYGVAVTLPDATTCSIGGPLHIIDNRGAYPVRLLNSAGTLLGFLFAGVVSHISLIDRSTAAGTWTVENSELVGASAQLLTANMTRVYSCVDLGSSRECLIGGIANGDIYGVVYDRSTNTFGSVTLIRTATTGTIPAQAVLSAANQVLVVSCNNAAAFEAVTLSISGTTIAVNTAATATLSANANTTAFADGCGLIAVGSSFVTSYTVVTPAAQIRALSISGTTVTIGSATVLPGTAGGLQTAIGSVDVVTSGAGVNTYVTPYTVSGTTLTVGTQATIANGGAPSEPTWQALLGTGNIFISYYSGTKTAIAKLTGTTVTLSDLGTTLLSGNAVSDAIVVGSNKVLVVTSTASNNVNILTDTAGTASAGTAATAQTGANRSCLYVDGTTVYVASVNGSSQQGVNAVDCSGASPVVGALTPGILNTTYTDSNYAAAVSNSVLSRSPKKIYGTKFARQLVVQNSASITYGLQTRDGITTQQSNVPFLPFSYNTYRGKSPSEVWVCDGSTKITKLECPA